MVITISGRKGERHGDRHPGFVEHCGEAAQQAGRDWPKSCGAEADQDDGQPQTVEEGLEDRLEGDRTPDVDPRCPVGATSGGKDEEHVTGSRWLKTISTDDPDWR